MSNNYLIDSDILIDFLDYGKSFPHQFETSSNHISIITYYEVKYGAAKQNKGGKLDKILSDLNISILDLTKDITNKSIKIRLKLEEMGNKLDHLDIFIASTAIEKDLILVTKNKNHFNRISNLRIF